MSPSIQLLKNRYLKNIKENPDLYIGIELEFPIEFCLRFPTRPWSLPLVELRISKRSKNALKPI